MSYIPIEIFYKYELELKKNNIHPPYWMRVTQDIKDYMTSNNMIPSEWELRVW